jgi:multiple sugar transport system permease protein/raffinose/stachyose/melibiose transport system permease protein
MKRASLNKLSKGLVVLLLLGFTLVIVGPFLWTFVMSFRPTNDIMDNPYTITWPPYVRNYIYAFTEFGFAQYIMNSTYITALALILTTVVTAMAAFGFGRKRFNFPLREVLFLIIFISIMFPPQITLLSLYEGVARISRVLAKIMPGIEWRFQGSRESMVLIYSASALAFNIYILRAFFSQIPQDLEDAARIDGCSDWNMFWRIMFPIATPAIATTIVINYISFWNEFLYAVTMITKQEARTLPLAVMFFAGEASVDIGMIATGLMVSVIPVIILYMILSEQFIKGMTAGALKG